MTKERKTPAHTGDCGDLGLACSAGDALRLTDELEMGRPVSLGRGGLGRLPVGRGTPRIPSITPDATGKHRGALPISCRHGRGCHPSAPCRGHPSLCRVVTSGRSSLFVTVAIADWDSSLDQGTSYGTRVHVEDFTDRDE